jgi:TatA/E family protein of Tat protein translocase
MLKCPSLPGLTGPDLKGKLRPGRILPRGTATSRKRRYGRHFGGVLFGSEKKGAHVIAFLQGIGAPELIIILVIVLLLFGAKKLPEMARSLGKSSREFKKGMREGAEEADLGRTDVDERERQEKAAD